jgi:hypothetical protein
MAAFNASCVLLTLFILQMPFLELSAHGFRAAKVPGTQEFLYMHMRYVLQFDGLAAVAHWLHVPSSTLPTQAAGVVPVGAAQTLLAQLSDRQSSLTLHPAPSAHCLQFES